MESTDELITNIENMKIDEETAKPRTNITVLFIGHVDAGKSTICGQILLQLNLIDSRLLQKLIQESKDLKRESWYLSYLMDTNPEERNKGKTTETGRAQFDLKTKRVYVLDCPGHKNYISEMINSAGQADIAILVISARINEFESGLKGQTRDHIILAKSLGVKKIVVLVNKMDDPSVNFSQERYDFICTKMNLFLKKVYRNENVVFIPVSGFLGINFSFKANEMPWYNGDCFLDYLDKVSVDDYIDNAVPGTCSISDNKKSDSCTLPTTNENNAEVELDKSNVDENKASNIKGAESTVSDPLSNDKMIFLVSEKLKLLGTTFYYGKITTGRISKNMVIKILPLNVKSNILSILDEEDCEMEEATKGDNIKLKIGSNNEDINEGSVFCDLNNADYNVSNEFTCSLAILDSKNIVPIGFKCIIHYRTEQRVCEIVDIRGKVNDKMVKKKFVKKGDKCLAKIVLDGMSTFYCGEDESKLDSFVLRDRDMTIAIGKVRKVIAK
ncbi:hypothetical protein EDEG_01882 [Edhazardia aedis USNM 41457]|uniref:Tr-type G domain-containing protein n=1 Tax=Edhazardia aedis (strain USNM 41457) TaxID=1003232 RepID=J9D8H5_EDHAE|nr:hypothetical protein EDEG_01882 [Edhazardia aedis USNM 41457]|eukprot:EJW03824.1 hypothetical protein EDEG_01882 [Edhazardia aedis USNM 41457]